MYDATSNSRGRIEVEQEEARGKRTTKAVPAETDSQIARFYVGTATAEPFD